MKGEGNQQDYGMRMYDPRLGRFLSEDPITKKYPELTPYQFASNRPIQGVDLDGLEVFLVTGTGSVFFLFAGYDIGAGVGVGKEGIALVTTQTIKAGFGMELGASVNETLFPTMSNLSDLDGVALGGSVSGAFLGRFGVGVTNSSGHWGATGSVGIGIGAHVSADAGATIGLKIIKWDQIVSSISAGTEESKSLKTFFGINDQNSANTVEIVKDYFTKLATGLRDKRVNDLKDINKKNSEVINDAEVFLKDYKKSGLIYRLSTFWQKKQFEASKKEAEKDIQKNNDEIKILEQTEINFE